MTAPPWGSNVPGYPPGHPAQPGYPASPPGYPAPSPHGRPAPPPPGYPVPPQGHSVTPPHGQPAPPPPGYPQHPHAAPPGYPHPAPPPLEFPGTPAVRAYLTAVTHHMTRGRMQIAQHMVGPLMSLVGVNAVIATALNPIDFVLCVATLEEISPAAVDDFPRHVDGFAKNQRRRSFLGVKGGAMGVAALVSERVHPAAVQALRNRPMSWGSVVTPAIVDLGNRRLHIASNTPAVGLAMWHGVRSQARAYLPEPRQVLG
ncbi:hypothetical protein [Nocardia bhagyanarayanae]|uniref:Uncharacterized protein n=1 Tax=Nocardia bhagyanarayanae TaxID=1215925 RepID=A0A543F490_9NOCA|nr:hypothetical protein [Nocardia bhagyanarayanae]TQM28645.1 hypothetical protein FB390_0218 [Nocardia bhagyanarayanae]